MSKIDKDNMNNNIKTINEKNNSMNNNKKIINSNDELKRYKDIKMISSNANDNNITNESHKKITDNLKSVQTEQIKNTTIQEGGNVSMDIEQLKKMYKMQQYINEMYDKKVKKQ